MPPKTQQFAPRTARTDLVLGALLLVLARLYYSYYRSARIIGTRRTTTATCPLQILTSYSYLTLTLFYPLQLLIPYSYLSLTVTSPLQLLIPYNPSWLIILYIYLSLTATYPLLFAWRGLFRNPELRSETSVNKWQWRKWSVLQLCALTVWQLSISGVAPSLSHSSTSVLRWSKACAMATSPEKAATTSKGRHSQVTLCPGVCSGVCPACSWKSASSALISQHDSCN